MNRWLNSTRMFLAPDDGTGATAATPAASGTDSAGTTAAPASSSSAAASAAPTTDAAAASASTSSPAPAADGAAKTDSSAAPVGDASPKSEPSLLTQADGKAKPDADAKPADGKAADTPAPAADPKPDAKAEPAKEAAKDEKAKDAAPDPAKDAPAAAPPAFVLEDLKVPEGAKLAEKEGKAFADLINNAEIGAKDKAQGLLDLHLAEVKRVADTISQQQRDAWTTFNDAEKNRLRTDPDLGGNRLNTTLAMAKAVVEEYLPAESASKLLAFMDYSGAGNQREMVELLHNIGRAMNVFEDKIVAANAKAPAMPKGSPGSGKTGWYPTMPNGAGGP